MKDVSIADLRNVVFMGHNGSGKTTLAEALLFKLGLNDRLGKVDAGNGMADFSEAERKRKLTIHAKSFSAGWSSGKGNRKGIVFFDTPGYADFFGQVIAAASAADAALIVVDANSGIQVGAMRAWKLCERHQIPRGIVITGLDRENADYEKALAGVRTAWGDQCVPVMRPSSDLSAVRFLLGQDSEDAEDQEVLNKLNELAAETDDDLIEKFLEGASLSAEELNTGLRKALCGGNFFPVFCAMPLKDVGLTELLEALDMLYPSPLDIERKDEQGEIINPASDQPLVGSIWRVQSDPFIGNLAMIRVLAGTLKPETEVFNVSKNQKERIAGLLEVNGKKQASVAEATAGDVVAMTKLKHSGLCDTLCAPGLKVGLPPLQFPKPVVTMAVTAKTQADEDKIGTALARLIEEEPTLKIERNDDTGEQLLSGMGDVHLDVAVEQMRTRSNANVLLSTPRVSYKETITATGEGHHKHKKQSGGRGQYGEVYLRVEPRQPEDEETFVNAIVGGVIPGNFIPAVQKGVNEGLQKGAMAGYPVTNVKVTVYDGSYHDVDSSEVAFKIAGARAFRDAMTKAKPVLLEPVMTIKIITPEQFMGDISGDISHKRGHIIGMEAEDGMQVITAEAPYAELHAYSAELRSMTSGRGQFEMDFARYDVVPANVAQKVVEAAAKEKSDDE